MIRERWGSRFGFIMTTAGFAVGLGNIWRFPYLTGVNGGGAFLLIYLLIAIAIGIPLFTAEIALGRKTQLTPVAGMRKLTATPTSPWNLIGWLGVLSAFLILSFYSLILGWVLAYFVQTGLGAFRGSSPDEVAAAFNGFVAGTPLVLLYTLAVVVMIGVIVMHGLRAGVERASVVLMPLLIALLVALAIGSLMLPGAGAGVRWYLAPDWSEVGAQAVLAALGQVFFSIGVGMAGTFAFGSYLNPGTSDVPGSAALVVACDTAAALLAGLVIFPAVFAFGLAPDTGPGLLFVTMTNVFAVAPAGAMVGAAFFFLVLIAGLTSAIGLVEALTASLMDSAGLSRRTALWGTLGASFLAGLPSALSFGAWSEVRFFGLDLFGLVDFVSGNIMLVLSGLLLALYTAGVWGFSAFQQEANVGAGRFRVAGWWRPFVQFVIPAAVALVLLAGLGLFS